MAPYIRGGTGEARKDQALSWAMWRGMELLFVLQPKVTFGFTSKILILIQIIQSMYEIQTQELISRI